jgi:Sec-independent protein secretion pathway component TatC
MKIRWLAIQRIRINNGYSVLGIFGIGIVIVESVQKLLLSMSIAIPMYYLYPIGVICLWITGFIYDKCGLFSAEQEYISERNTYFQRYMKKDLK